MIPADPEARIYLLLVVVLAVTVLFMIFVTRTAQKQADRADLRARILRSQLDGANRALDWWKMTDRQRTTHLHTFDTRLQTQATAAAGDRELDSPAEAAAAAVHRHRARVHADTEETQP